LGWNQATSSKPQTTKLTPAERRYVQGGKKGKEMHFSTARRIVRWKFIFDNKKIASLSSRRAGGRAGGPVIIIKGRENERERERGCKSWKQQQHEVEKNKTTNNNKKDEKEARKCWKPETPPPKRPLLSGKYNSAPQ
jgi:hypothetical protein